jgi:hypothetical protein
MKETRKKMISDVRAELNSGSLKVNLQVDNELPECRKEKYHSFAKWWLLQH